MDANDVKYIKSLEEENEILRDRLVFLLNLDLRKMILLKKKLNVTVPISSESLQDMISEFGIDMEYITRNVFSEVCEKIYNEFIDEIIDINNRKLYE